MKFIVGIIISFSIIMALMDSYRVVRDSSGKLNMARGFLLVTSVLVLVASLFYLVFSNDLNILTKSIFIFISVLLFGKVTQLIF